MAKTAVADIIIPTEFEKYAIERTAELSVFGQCGIIEMAPEFDALAAGGGREVKMPFWKDLTAARQLLADNASLAVNKITSDQDIARIHNDAQVWGVNHLAKVVSGDDPLQAIVDLVADYWARTDEGLLISCLKGIFAAASMAGNKLSIASETIAGQSAATRMNGATFVDATVKLGDREATCHGVSDSIEPYYTICPQANRFRKAERHWSLCLITSALYSRAGSSSTIESHGVCGRLPASS